MSLVAYVKRVDESLPLPSNRTAGSVGYDLCSRIDVDIEPGSITYIPLNVIVEPPEGYWVFMAVRSSAHKMGIMAANGVGIFDTDFCGPEDEMQLAAFNFTTKPVRIEKGTRIAQLLFHPLSSVDIVEIKHINKQSRGGFGSTGK